MRYAAAIVVLGALAACGGGSDSDGPPAVTFTTVSAIEADSYVKTRESVARVVQIVVGGDGTITKTGDATVPYDARLLVRFDEAADLVAARIQPLGVNLDAGRPGVERDVAAADPRFVVLAEDTIPKNVDRAVMADPGSAGLEHLLLGVWLQPNISFFDVAFLGGAAFGTFTPRAAVPIDGTATYTGPAIGHRVTADGVVRAVSSTATLTADFTQAAATFSTDAGLDIASGAVLPDLASNGTLVISGNRLSGFGATAGGLSGPIDGRFFGPAAEEAGGAFDFKGAGVERYIGAFGAKQ